jgi:hypothetical protein
MARRRQAWSRLLEDAGYTPRFVSSGHIEKGGLKDARVIVLPDSIALSDTEFDLLARSLDEAAPGRALFGSAAPGMFDAHGKLNSTREFKPLTGVVAPGISPWYAHAHGESKGHGVFAGDIAGQLLLRRGAIEELPSGGRKDGSSPFEKLTEKEREEYPEALTGLVMMDQLRASLPPAVQVPRRACLRTHRYHLGKARLVAFERNVDYHMSEDLKQAGGNEALEKPVSFGAKLAGKAHVYDLRAKKYLGETDRIAVDLEPWKPSLFALLPEKIAEDVDLLEYLERQGS